MRLKLKYEGRERTVTLPKEDAVLGRSVEGSVPDVDLGSDTSVSRKHARIWLRDGQYWVQDLGSTYGTFVNGIATDYKRQLRPGDRLRIGETYVTVDSLDEETPTVCELDDDMPTVKEAAKGALNEVPAPRPAEEPVKVPTVPNPTIIPPHDNVEVSSVLNAEEAFNPAQSTDGTEFQHRISMLLELPLRFASQTAMDPLFQTIVQRLVSLLPGARRAALLLTDKSTDKLLLKAHHPPGDTSVSETLARRALATREGFVWNRRSSSDEIPSMMRLQTESGIYAPLLWQGESVGVLCVDNSSVDTPFLETDLRFVLSIAHYAAAAVANAQLRRELQNKTTALERLLTQFSPKLRAHLLDLAMTGKLRPGGSKSEVTILLSDIRGFTNTASTMDPQDVVDMLDDYFPPLVQAIFQHDGTIDKFVGDAILAVFGSPEADPQQHEKAVFAALAMQEAMNRVNERRKRNGEIVCGIGIGVHSGEVLHGFIGAAERLEFTVIGDAVNKTARYCDGAKPGEVLISPAVFERAYRSISAEPTSIPTKHEGDLPAYRVKASR